MFGIQDDREVAAIDEILHFCVGRSEANWQKIASTLTAVAPDVEELLNRVAYEQGSRDAHAEFKRNRKSA